ncbi:MAG: hypothetical protein QXT58_04825 [Archaeoglobaceae archaeon]
MAFIARVTLGSSVKVSRDFQSEEVTVIVSWEMERGDDDLLRFIRIKAVELEEARSLLAQTLQEVRAYKEKVASSKDFQTTLPETTASSKPTKRQRGVRMKEAAEDESDDAEKLEEEMRGVQSVATQGTDVSSELHSSTLPEQKLIPRPPSPEPNQPLTDAQKRAVLVLAQRLMDLQELPNFLQQHMGKSNLDDLTWKEAAGLIGEFQKMLKARREKEASQEVQI